MPRQKPPKLKEKFSHISYPAIEGLAGEGPAGILHPVQRRVLSDLGIDADGGHC